MDKPINRNINPIPEIKPLDEIITEEDELRMATQEELENEIIKPNINFEHSEVFINIDETNNSDEETEGDNNKEEQEHIEKQVSPPSPPPSPPTKRNANMK